MEFYEDLDLAMKNMSKESTFLRSKAKTAKLTQWQ